MTNVEKLLFRIIARKNPHTLCLVSESTYNLDIFRFAKSDIVIKNDIEGCDDQTLLCTDHVEIATKFNRRCKGTILLTDIRKDRKSEAAFKSFVADLEEGIIIDIFHSAIFVYLPDVVYLYRSTQ